MRRRLAIVACCALTFAQGAAAAAEPECAPAPVVAFHHRPHVAAAGPWIAVSQPTDDAVVVYEVRDGAVTPFATIGRRGTRAGEFDGPTGIAIDGSRSRLYVSDTANHRLQVFAIEPSARTPAERVRFLKAFDGRTSGRALCFPTGLALDAAGGLYVADEGTSRIVSFDEKLGFVRAIDGRSARDEPAAIVDLAWDEPRRRLLAVDAAARTIDAVTPNGPASERAAALADDGPTFVLPLAIAAGRQDALYAVDYGAHLVEILTPNGRAKSTIGGRGDRDGEFNAPVAVTVHETLGLLVLDFAGGRLQSFDPDGRWTGSYKLGGLPPPGPPK